MGVRVCVCACAFLCACASLNKQNYPTGPQPLHSGRRDHYIQLIREAKVDFPLAGPITAGPSVNSVNKVMAGSGCNLGKARQRRRHG